MDTRGGWRRDIAKTCENVEQGGQSPIREGEGEVRILLGGVTTLREREGRREHTRKRKKEKRKQEKEKDAVDCSYCIWE